MPKAGMRRLLLLMSIAALSGCAQMLWTDSTGKHRSGARAEADYRACSAEAMASGTGESTGYDENNAGRRRLLICMYSRGWRRTDLQHF
jgi:uncharacterized protein YceK